MSKHSPKKWTFDKWFNAQFPRNKLAEFYDKTDAELLDMLKNGKLAKDELEHRYKRSLRQDAARLAWNVHTATPAAKKKGTKDD